MKHLAPRLLITTLLFAATLVAQGQSVPERIRGDVVALDGLALTVRTDGGQVQTVRLAKDFRVSARSRADIAAIAPGTFLGTTATPQADGTLAAVEVHVFPESMRGTGEGHRPMAAIPGSTMTNATVARIAPADAGNAAGANATMTNATVANVAAAGGGRKITLRYPEGEKTVVVADSVPVVMVEPGDASMLVPGAHVVVTAVKGADGTLTADRITVGRNGLVPPG